MNDFHEWVDKLTLREWNKVMEPHWDKESALHKQAVICGHPGASTMDCLWYQYQQQG